MALGEAIMLIIVLSLNGWFVRCKKKWFSFTVEKLTAAYVKGLIMEHSVHASAIQVAFVGLPYSGKSSLLKSLLEPNRGPGEEIVQQFGDAWSGLSVFEAVRLRDMIVGECEWLPATKFDAVCCTLAVALAQVFMRKGHRVLPKNLDNVELFGDPAIDAHFYNVFSTVVKVMQHVEHCDKLKFLSTASLTFINLWDLGTNKALYEFIGAAASIGKIKNLLLVDVLDLSRDPQRLEQKLDMRNEALYGKHCSGQKPFELFRLRTTLAYYILMILGAMESTLTSHSALLVGTHADSFAENQDGLKEAIEKVQVGVKARASDYGLQDVVCPGLLSVDAKNPEDVAIVKDKLNGLIDEGNHFRQDIRFEPHIRLSWVFLRTTLHSTKRLFMSKAEILKYAYKCGLRDEDELDKFLMLFKDCASIIYSSTDEIRVLHENVVLNPAEFIQGLDSLYSVNCKVIPEPVKPHLELLKYGFITPKLAKDIWKDVQKSEFYITVLEEFGLMTHVQPAAILVTKSVGLTQDTVQELNASGAFFLPTLRSEPHPKKPSKNDSKLLILGGDSFLIARMVFHRQSTLLNYFTSEYPKNVKLIVGKEDVYYNALHLQWLENGKPQAEVHIHFHGVYGSIDIQPLTDVQESAIIMCYSAVKAAAVNVLGKDDQNFRLGFICDKSKETDYPDGLHFVKFHHLDPAKDNLFCERCHHFMPMTVERKWWMNDLWLVSITTNAY